MDARRYVVNVVRMIRPDYWPKNLFVLIGSALAVFYLKKLSPINGTISFLVFRSFVAVFIALLAASANYILNELCDAKTDIHHPTKRMRAVAAGEISATVALCLWGVFAAAGLAVAALVNRMVVVTTLVFLVSGILYNVKPLRLKDIPYLDIIAEAFNNPIRLFLGWFALLASRVPPLSLIFAYWMGGAFLMAAKRLVEIERLRPSGRAAQYRKSLAFYTKDSIVLQMFFYATMTAFLLGVFIARYHVELVIIIPLLAACFTGYVKAAISPAVGNEPEALYKHKGLAVLLGCTFVIGVLLLFVKLDFLRRVLNIQEPSLPPLWPTAGM
mgnify:CR=1 FL=1